MTSNKKDEFYRLPDGGKIPLLKPDNYHIWRTMVTRQLKIDKLWDYVTGASVRPVDPQQGDDEAGVMQIRLAQETWDEKNMKIVNFLVMTCNLAVARNVNSMDNSKELWVALKRYDLSATSAGRGLILIRFNSTMKSDEESITEYIDKFRALVDPLKGTPEEVSDWNFRGRLLTSLGEEWDNICNHLQVSEDSLDKCISMLVKTEEAASARTAIRAAYGNSGTAQAFTASSNTPTYGTSLKMKRPARWCSMHNSSSHSDLECYQQIKDRENRKRMEGQQNSYVLVPNNSFQVHPLQQPNNVYPQQLLQPNVAQQVTQPNTNQPPLPLNSNGKRLLNDPTEGPAGVRQRTSAVPVYCYHCGYEGHVQASCAQKLEAERLLAAVGRVPAWKMGKPKDQGTQVMLVENATASGTDVQGHAQGESGAEVGDMNGC